MAREIEIDFTCDNCPTTLTALIVIDHGGSYPAIHSLSTGPGCGCEWHVVEGVVCDNCRQLHTQDWLEESEHINEQVQQADAEWTYDD